MGALGSFPAAIPASAPAPAASYLGLAESLLQADDLVALVGDDGAQHADALRVTLTEALQQFAVLGASPLSQKLPVAGLHQHVALLPAPTVVLAQVRLAQRGFAAQARLHRGLRLLEAGITQHHLPGLARAFPLLLALPFLLFLLLARGSIQELLHNVAEVEVGPQLREGRVAERAPGRALLVAERLLDAVLAEAVAAARARGLLVDVQADGTGQLFLQPGHGLCLGHACSSGQG